jgi:hypothetical protein
MNKNLLNNYRMAGYLLIALGLINLRYQTGMSGVVGNSLIVIIPGALLLLSTWLPGLAKVLDTRATKSVVIVTGLILIAFAILN